MCCTNMLSCNEVASDHTAIQKPNTMPITNHLISHNEKNLTKERQKS